MQEKPFYDFIPAVDTPEFPIEKLGNRLDLYRKYRGLQCQQFAPLLGIRQSSYSAIKNNINLPSATTIINLYSVEQNLLIIKWILTGEKT